MAHCCIELERNISSFPLLHLLIYLISYPLSLHHNENVVAIWIEQSFIFSNDKCDLSFCIWKNILFVCQFLSSVYEGTITFFLLHPIVMFDFTWLILLFGCVCSLFHSPYFTFWSLCFSFDSLSRSHSFMMPKYIRGVQRSSLVSDFSLCRGAKNIGQRRRVAVL